MLFKPFLITKIIAGQKTQTRRLVKPGNTTSVWDSEIVAVYTPNGRQRFAAGQNLAVCPGRGKPGVFVAGLRTTEGVELHLVNEDSPQLYQAIAVPLRIRITKICREDVRNISEEDARAEGFQDRGDFWHTWVEMHDSRFYPTFRYAIDTDQLREYEFWNRPDRLYDAWALTFEVVK